MEAQTTVAAVTAAIRIVLDVLHSRTPITPGQSFRMTTTCPTLMWTPERRQAAERFAHLVPATATLDDAPRIAERIAPLLSAGHGR